MIEIEEIDMPADFAEEAEEIGKEVGRSLEDQILYWAKLGQYIDALFREKDFSTLPSGDEFEDAVSKIGAEIV